MTEKWVAIKGHEDYMISSKGRVLSLRRGKYLKQDSSSGYHRVTLSEGGKTTRYLVHRLVAAAFVDNKLDLPMVNHKDGDKSNNLYSNLEWVTCSENTIHAFNNSLRATGEYSANAKLTNREVEQVCSLIEKGWKRGSILRACPFISKHTFDDIRRRKTWRRISCNYKW